MKLSQNLKLAIDAAIQAGKKIIEIYNSDDFNLEYKLDDSPLTIADTASNKIIENILEASNIPILSEEGNILDFNNLTEENIYVLDSPILSNSLL